MEILQKACLFISEGIKQHSNIKIWIIWLFKEEPIGMAISSFLSFRYTQFQIKGGTLQKISFLFNDRVERAFEHQSFFYKQFVELKSITFLFLYFILVLQTISSMPYSFIFPTACKLVPLAPTIHTRTTQPRRKRKTILASELQHHQHPARLSREKAPDVRHKPLTQHCTTKSLYLCMLVVYVSMYVHMCTVGHVYSKPVLHDASCN